MNYYSFHIGDYRSATAHLTNEEDLCYRRILDTYYDRNGNLPEIKLLSRKIRCEEGMVEAILGEFFEEVEGGWIHRRAQKEVDDYIHRVESARVAGKASAASRTRPTATEPQRPLNGTSTTVEPPLSGRQPTIPHSPFPIPQEPITNTSTNVGGGGGRDWSVDFEEWWNSYPSHRRQNRHRAESEWSAVRLSLPPQNELLGALAAFKSSPQWKGDSGKFIPAPHVWLSERRWQDAPAYSAPQKPKSTNKVIPKVDEVHARVWLADNYVGSDPSMSFEQWPPFAQKDYLAFISGKNQPTPQAA